MKKFNLLLLDANVVIYLFKLGIWQQVIERCDVHLARTIVESEAQFYETDDGHREYFNFQKHISNREITVFDVIPSDLNTLRNSFDPGYFEKLDPGETESLAYLLNLDEKGWICSADKIVFRVLGNLYKEDYGISLEELLQAVGLGRPLPQQFTKMFREKWTREGSRERIQGMGWQK
jgi:hypothetical protein